MKKIGKPILAFILFLFIQGIVSVLAGVIALVTHRDALQSAMQGDGTALHEIVKQPTLLGLTLIVSSIVTILVIKGIGMMSFKNAFCSKGITLPNSLLAIIAAVTGIAATNIFSEMIDLPNIIEVQITSMSSNIWGILAISLFGPIAEEVVFREGILGHTLRNGMKPWAAICFSALLFGLIHLNPAQIPFAFCVGLILGFIYYRTGNIVLTSIIYIINNSFSCLLLYLYGNKANDIKMCDYLGGASIPCIVIFAALCIWLLIIFKKKTQDIAYVTERVAEPATEEPADTDDNQNITE